MNRPRKKLKRAALLGMALCIVVSLPLSAMAADLGGMDSTLSAETIYAGTRTVTSAAFLSRMFLVTDGGRPPEGTTRAQYVAFLYAAAGAPLPMWWRTPPTATPSPGPSSRASSSPRWR